MKSLVRRVPVLGPALQGLYRRWIRPPRPFPGSANYWIERYEAGGHSGDGSYGELARFKAEVLNDFVRQRRIESVIEFGCGDGHQLTLAEYPSYLGFDVSPKAVALCRERFAHDRSKRFELASEYAGERAQLSLSLDVIYHLVEDDVFAGYMHRLFDSASRAVIIYSSNTDHNQKGIAAHVRNRRFSAWVERERLDWSLHRHVPNRHPFQGDTRTGSISDFFIYEKV